jgi:hypothetical protein
MGGAIDRAEVLGNVERDPVEFRWRDHGVERPAPWAVFGSNISPVTAA